MNNLNIPELPHGHGLSFKKGISQVLLGSEVKISVPEGHEKSYRKGVAFGEKLRERINSYVK